MLVSTTYHNLESFICDKICVFRGHSENRIKLKVTQIVFSLTACEQDTNFYTLHVLVYGWKSDHICQFNEYSFYNLDFGRSKFLNLSRMFNIDDV